MNGKLSKKDRDSRRKQRLSARESNGKPNRSVKDLSMKPNKSVSDWKQRLKPRDRG